jgi:tetratricopeptide (TPR) repeat protein
MKAEVTLCPTKAAVATVKTDTRQRCEHALKMLLTQHGDPLIEVEQILADDPRCVFGHCLRTALIVRDDKAAQQSMVGASVAAIEAACPEIDHPARRHAAAARAWLDGNSDLAVALYSGVLDDWPHDILALAVAHALDFHLGRPRGMRDRIAQVLPRWTAAVPGYPSLLAMYAFALEENGQYRRAEKMARRALALDPEHAGAIHVVAHVMEMQGRAHDGLAFLAETETAWAEGAALSLHLAWHRALFYLEASDFKSALSTCDALIASAGTFDIPVLADGSALLWRLQLQDIDVSDRWQMLANRWEMQTLTDARSFYIVHAMMAFAAAKRASAAARLIEALRAGDQDGTQSLSPEEAIALPLCEALLAFARNDYAACVEWLVRVRHIARRCGGSLAQCDLIHLTLTEAALRARKANVASTLVAERIAQKPTSGLNRLLQQRLRMAVPI